jgi:hypothetical protein
MAWTCNVWHKNDLFWFIPFHMFSVGYHVISYLCQDFMYVWKWVFFPQNFGCIIFSNFCVFFSCRSNHYCILCFWACEGWNFFMFWILNAYGICWNKVNCKFVLTTYKIYTLLHCVIDQTMPGPPPSTHISQPRDLLVNNNNKRYKKNHFVTHLNKNYDLLLYFEQKEMTRFD